MSAEAIAPLNAAALEQVELEVEQHALSALLGGHREGWDAAAATGLTEEHFSHVNHRTIFAAMSAVAAAGGPPNGFSAAQQVRQAAGDVVARYMTGIMASMLPARPSDCRHLAAVVIEQGQRRVARFEMTAAITELTELQADPATTPARLAEIGARVAAAGQLVGGGSLKTIGEAANAALDAADLAWKAPNHVTGVPTGLHDLDQALGGLQPSDFLVIAGRPGMGKTALATTIARGAAAAGRRVLIASLEMSAMQLAQRLLAERSGISAERQRKGAFGLGDMTSMIEAQREIAELPIVVDDGHDQSVLTIRARARELKRSGGLDLVVVDYLQLMIGGKAENRTLELSAMTRDMKAMAKELDCPVIALSQLSRAVEAREDKRPQLSDLRESGSIEQDADVVVFIYRDEYYRAREAPRQRTGESDAAHGLRKGDHETLMERCRGLAELLIEKNRHGPTRVIAAAFDGARGRFADLARNDG